MTKKNTASSMRRHFLVDERIGAGIHRLINISEALNRGEAPDPELVKWFDKAIEEITINDQEPTKALDCRKRAGARAQTIGDAEYAQKIAIKVARLRLAGKTKEEAIANIANELGGDHKEGHVRGLYERHQKAIEGIIAMEKDRDRVRQQALKLVLRKARKALKP